MSKDNNNFTSGVKVVNSEDCGRVAVATKAFSPGTVVFRESPAIVFDPYQQQGDHEYHGLFESFLKAPPQTKNDILDMHCPSAQELAKFSSKVGESEYERLEQERLSFLQENPQLLVDNDDSDDDGKNQLTVETSRKLVSIVDANAMAFGQAESDSTSYSNNSTDDNEDGESKDDDDSATTGSSSSHQKMALFTIGSKAEHSCCPNLTWTTQRGRMECVAETHIEPGDRLSISYVANVFEKPCQERRNVLKCNKFFHCNCQRCRNLDSCRPLWCKCSEHGILLWSGKEKKWVCTSCSPDKERDDFIASVVQIESGLDRKIHEYQWKAENEPHPELLSDIVFLVMSDDWNQTLHPLHWLNVTAYKLISTTAALHTNMKMMEESFPPALSKFSPLLRLFSLALLRQIAWLEQSVAIAREGLELQDLDMCEQVLSNGCNGEVAKGRHLRISSEGADSIQVVAALDELCLDYESSSPGRSEEKKDDEGSIGQSAAGSEVAVPVFHAGQNLILAGDSDLALRLFKAYSPCMQRCSIVSPEDKARLQTFVSSDGSENPFGSPLLEA